jgi:hypothetical protein
MTSPTTKRACAIGLRFLALCDLKRTAGADWSVRVNSSWCSGQPVWVVTLIHRPAGGKVQKEVPFVGEDLAALLERACEAVEGRGSGGLV